MPRPIKWRRVGFVPEVTYFKPAGIPLRGLEEVKLSVEEVEAIRLKDLEGLEQEECAGKMNISRPTFHRVLESARKKVAEALLQGKAIRIEGGNFQLAWRRFSCPRGHQWDIPFEKIIAGSPGRCPHCSASGIVLLQPPGFHRGEGGGGRFHRERHGVEHAGAEETNGSNDS